MPGRTSYNLPADDREGAGSSDNSVSREVPHRRRACIRRFKWGLLRPRCLRELKKTRSEPASESVYGDWKILHLSVGRQAECAGGRLGGRCGEAGLGFADRAAARRYLIPRCATLFCHGERVGGRVAQHSSGRGHKMGGTFDVHDVDWGMLRKSSTASITCGGSGNCRTETKGFTAFVDTGVSSREQTSSSPPDRAQAGTTCLRRWAIARILPSTNIDHIKAYWGP